MLVTLIAALAHDHVIGSAQGKIPWDLPRDREHFRARTADRWLLVGRRTYLEMEGWFGARTPLVLTSDPNFRTFHPSHRPVTSVAAALDLARKQAVPELFVCGGASIFAATLPFADRLLLTRIDLRAEIADPVHFPEFEHSGQWKLRYTESWPSESTSPSARYEIYVRE